MGRQLRRNVPCLRLDFGHHELPPQLLPQRPAHPQLRIEPPHHLRMINHRQQNGCRQMIAPANHHGRVTLGQLRQRPVGVSRLRMIHQHDADILARHLANRLAIALQNKLLIANRKMSRLAADF